MRWNWSARLSWKLSRALLKISSWRSCGRTRRWKSSRLRRSPSWSKKSKRKRPRTPRRKSNNELHPRLPVTPKKKQALVHDNLPFLSVTLHVFSWQFFHVDSVVKFNSTDTPPLLYRIKSFSWYFVFFIFLKILIFRTLFCPRFIFRTCFDMWTMGLERERRFQLSFLITGGWILANVACFSFEYFKLNQRFSNTIKFVFLFNFFEEKSIFTRESFSDVPFCFREEQLKQSISTFRFCYSPFAAIFSPLHEVFFRDHSASFSTMLFTRTNVSRTP